MFDFSEIAKAFLTQVTKHLDKHTTEKGFIEVKNNAEVTEITLFTPAHIQFAAYGRAAGKKPPLDPILKWVTRKGIIIEGTDALGTAFAIQKSIAKKGTANYKPNAPNVIEEAIGKELGKYNKSIANLFTIQTKGEVTKVYENTFEETQKFKI